MAQGITLKKSKKSLMPPWWVYQKTGAERPASGRSVWVLILWVSRQTLAITLHREYCLVAHLSGASCVLRDGVELNSFAVKLRFHHFACLSCRSPGRRPELQGCRYDFNVVEWYSAGSDMASQPC